MDRRIPSYAQPYTLTGLSATSFPFYNLIEREDRKGYILEIALAGYKKEDLSVSIVDNIVTVKGTSPVDNGARYLHKGISSKDFRTSVQIQDKCTVTKASFNNGILSIFLQKKEETIIPITIDEDDVSEEKQFLTEKQDIV